MRILTIRGNNLASLAGPFEVDLTAPPLAGQGLYAITGRTGAGKSTVLDALCLALFDRTPRYTDVADRRPDKPSTPAEAESEARDRLAPTDCRGILRKGCVVGAAEVLFLGIDGQRYLARWEVRRARNRPDGRLQPSTQSLEHGDTGQPLAAGKREVQLEIQRRLGLDFEQFRRSVLLAQGDFAAFLRSREGERAELLERMTGTEIYGLISKLAHEKSAAVNRELVRLEQEVARQGGEVLTPEARQALEQELTELGLGLVALRQQEEAARQAQRWHGIAAQLRSEEAEAQAAAVAAEAEQTAAAPRVAELAAVTAVQPWRGLWASVTDTEARLGRQQQAVQQARLATEQAGQQVATRSQELDSARSARDQTREALQTARPQIAEARQLDERLGQLSGQLRDAAQRTVQAQQELAREAQALGQLQQERVVQAERGAVATAWLQEQAALAPLAGHWSRWQDQLTAFAQAWSGQQAVGAELVQAAEQLGAADREVEQRTADTTRAVGRVAVAEQQLVRLEEQLRGVDEARLTDQTRALGQERQRWAEGHRLAQAADQQRQQEQQQRQLAASAQEALRLARDRADQARQALEQQRLALDEARLTLARIQAIQDVAHRRAELIPGEPCPLCGAREHPYAAAAPAVATLLTEQRQRVAELEQQLEQTQQDRIRATEQSKSELRRLRDAEAALTQAQTELERLREGWQLVTATPSRRAQPWPAEPGGSGAATGLEQWLLELEQAEQALTREQAALQQLRQQERQARAAEKKAGAALQSCQQVQRQAEQRQSEIREQQLKLEQRRTGQQERIREALDRLAEAFPAQSAWREELTAAPERFIRQCRQQVERWQQQTRLQEEAAQRGQALEQELAVAQTRLNHQQAAVADQQRQEDACRTELAQARRAREQLLDGRPTATVEQELTAGAAQGEEQHEQARVRLDHSRQAYAEWQGRLAADEQQCAAEEETRAAVTDRLGRVLAELGLERAQLAARLAHGEDWIRAQQQALVQLADAVRQQQTLLRERTRRRVEHEAGPGPALDAAAALVAEQEARQAAGQLQARDEELRIQRLRDDTQRERLATLLQTRTATEQQGQVWRQLGSLIGSSDGKKFRVFAQGLTLELLLAHANLHLQTIAPRYSLGRVAGQQLALQVIDHDMGDEERGVHSLSGGESFLASLALALGLASLSSQRTSIGSLFIDEGFGALDQDALEQALAALDSLQATGRQVGIISHIPAIAERVGAQVRVVAQGAGRSRILVRS